MFVKFIYPDKSCCYRAMRTVIAVYEEDGKMWARVHEAKDIFSTMKTFEIIGCELLGPHDKISFNSTEEGRELNE